MGVVAGLVVTVIVISYDQGLGWLLTQKREAERLFKVLVGALLGIVIDFGVGVELVVLE